VLFSRTLWRVLLGLLMVSAAFPTRAAAVSILIFPTDDDRGIDGLLDGNFLCCQLDAGQATVTLTTFEERAALERCAAVRAGDVDDPKHVIDLASSVLGIRHVERRQDVNAPGHRVAAWIVDPAGVGPFQLAGDSVAGRWGGYARREDIGVLNRTHWPMGYYFAANSAGIPVIDRTSMSR
jgi:hypothetical protein